MSNSYQILCIGKAKIEETIRYLIDECGASSEDFILAKEPKKIIEEYVKHYQIAGKKTKDYSCVINYYPLYNRYYIHSLCFEHDEAETKNYYRYVTNDTLDDLREQITENLKKLRVADENARKSKPEFLIGFEIEGCVHSDWAKDLYSYIRSLYGKFANIHTDGSIRPPAGFIAFEFSSPPLPMQVAFEKLEWLFGMLSVLGKEKVFETNDTCGFHVNISEKNIFVKGSSILRNKFAFSFMKKFDPKKWNKAFNRQNNRYSVWKKKPASVEDIYNDGNYTSHYSAISLESLHSEHDYLRRMEIRCAGNKKYHDNSKVKNFLVDVEETLIHARQGV